MTPKKQISIFWYRRDLRLSDNVGLLAAIQSGNPVMPVFIFDEQILQELPEDDSRVTFIYDQLKEIHRQLSSIGSALHIYKGAIQQIYQNLIDDYQIQSVFANRDYEPYAIKRDNEINELLSAHGIVFNLYKDQVIFEQNDVLKQDLKPYTVYTPYKNKWLSLFADMKLSEAEIKLSPDSFLSGSRQFPELSELGFKRSDISVRPYDVTGLKDYENERNIPSIKGTSDLSPHLRFGTIGIRSLVLKIRNNETFLNELIWREFFMQILFHFPHVVDHNFKAKYDGVLWRNNNDEFDRWCQGNTGYPMVDAGMRELNTTGYMHNRVRMVVAGFLCKHLLIDWRWGEAYFAKKLLDYELSSNNGNWQWSAGTGCDSAPYFRIFNPTTQIKKFDPQLIYIKKWVPELDTLQYPTPIVDHKAARERALQAYKIGLQA